MKMGERRWAQDEQPSDQDMLGTWKVHGEAWADRLGQHIEGQAEGFQFQTAFKDKLMMV